MKITITCNENTYTKDVDESESAVWKEIAQNLPNMSIPNVVTVDTPVGNACLDVGVRGSYVKDGIERPSMFVRVKYNYINLPVDTYQDAYLTCVNSESNNYKFYWLRPQNDGINATYGRIGAANGEMFGARSLKQPYESYVYWIRYYEKLSKGYTDQTDIYLTKKTPKKKAKKTKTGPVNTVSEKLYQQLFRYARHVVSSSLINKDVTLAQIKESKRILSQLGQRKTVNGFNTQLLKLLAICPRRIAKVSDLLAYDKTDFAEIVMREENLIAAMEGSVSNNIVITNDSFASFGIEVYEATDKQKQQVLAHLSDSLKGKVKTVYRVVPKKQKERFDKYLEKNHIKKVMQLWHGSRNENWLSIMNSGLSLNPNAVITGKMFGNGIYFAQSSMKSWNYTSYRGTYWANGNDTVGFMGLYATAYGTPLDVSSSGNYNQSALQRQNCNCVHAHAGTQLRNDEIIFYDEAAMVLNYIVEFE